MACEWLQLNQHRIQWLGLLEHRHETLHSTEDAKFLDQLSNLQFLEMHSTPCTYPQFNKKKQTFPNCKPKNEADAEKYSITDFNSNHLWQGKDELYL